MTMLPATMSLIIFLVFSPKSRAINECYSVVGSGLRIGGQFVSRRYSEPSLSQCANKCLRANSLCRSFSYRSSDLLENQISIDLNCELTSAAIGSLTGNQTDNNNNNSSGSHLLTSAAGYRTYSLSDLTACRASAGRVSLALESRDCFRRVITGRRLATEFARYSLRSSSLSRCQQSCMDADFFCTAFSYRTDYNSNQINCELSAEAGWEERLADAAMFDTYERQRTVACGYFGAGALGAADGVQHTGTGSSTASSDGQSTTITTTTTTTGTDCYRLTGPGQSLNYAEVSRRLAAASMHLCQQTCSQAAITCHAFSYRRSNFESDKNCFLTSSAGQPLTSVDRDFDTYSRGHGVECAGSGGAGAGGAGSGGTGVGGTDTTVVKCFRLNAPDSRLRLSLLIRNVITSTVHNCAEECKLTSGCKSFSYRRDSTGGQLNCEMSMSRVLTGPGGLTGAGGSSVVTRDPRYDTYSREYGLACRVDPGPVTGASGADNDCYTLVSDSKRLQHFRVDIVFRAVSQSQCQQACIETTNIACRSYSYSYESRDANCALSREDAYPNRLVPDRGARTFQRDFSRQCHVTNMTSTNDVCFRMVATHSRLVNTRTERRLQSTSLASCRGLCRSFGCRSFSFKPASYTGELNCRLTRSTVSPRDLIRDLGHATFMRQDTPDCRDPATPPGPAPGCFSYVGSDACHQTRFIDGAVIATDIQHCQNECALISECGTLSFRSSNFGEPNCLLSRQNGFTGATLLHAVLQPQPGWVILQKQNTPAICPPVTPLQNQLPPPAPIGFGSSVFGPNFTPNFGPGDFSPSRLGPNDLRPAGARPNSLAPTGSFPVSSVIVSPVTAAGAEGSWTARPHGNTECYRLLRQGQRLDGHILQSLQLQHLSECERACTGDRRCISFNFRSDPVASVCELADVDSETQYVQFAASIGWNFYERDPSSYCSGWDNSYYQQHNYGYAYCSVRVQAGLVLGVSAVRRDISVNSLHECEQACRDENQFRCQTFSFGLLLPDNQLSCQLTDTRVSDLSPRDTLPRPSFEIYDFHGNGRGCDRVDDQYDYRHGHVVTCSGQRCARGPCRIDRAGGFWYCFTDVDDAVWDYCCDPDSSCRTDPRMTLPTCYVTQQRGLYRNAALDTAWRPCHHQLQLLQQQQQQQQQQQRFAYLRRSLSPALLTTTAGNRSAAAAIAAAAADRVDVSDNHLTDQQL